MKKEKPPRVVQASAEVPMPTKEEIQVKLREGYARMTKRTLEEVQQELDSGGGDMRLSSVQVVTLASMLKKHFKTEILNVADLDPRKLNSYKNLTELAEKALLKKQN